MRRELEDYNREGVSLMLNGNASNPKKIARAFSIEEEGVYMRDYVANEKGEICQVRFDLIKKENK